MGLFAALLASSILLPAATGSSRAKVYVPDHKMTMPMAMASPYGPVVMPNTVNTGKIIRERLKKCSAAEIVSDKNAASYIVTALGASDREGARLDDSTGKALLTVTDTKNERKIAKEICDALSVRQPAL
jgi:hypothetical protein